MTVPVADKLFLPSTSALELHHRTSWLLYPPRVCQPESSYNKQSTRV